VQDLQQKFAVAAHAKFRAGRTIAVLRFLRQSETEGGPGRLMDSAGKVAQASSLRWLLIRKLEACATLFLVFGGDAGSVY